MKENKLTPKQKSFADFYVETGNATESYLKAYNCKKETADTNGARMLGNARIKEYIDNLIAEKDDDQIAKQDEVLRYLTKVMRREEKEHAVVTLRKSNSWYDENGKKNTVDTEEVEIVAIPSKLSDANKAAELLGKRYILWTEKKELSGNLGVIIVDDLDDDDE